jgi:2-methylisocitrate lyase-like PEP mutase family enzyme
LRKLLSEPDIIVAPGAHNAFTAKIIEQTGGFHAGRRYGRIESDGIREIFPPETTTPEILTFVKRLLGA